MTLVKIMIAKCTNTDMPGNGVSIDLVHLYALRLKPRERALAHNNLQNKLLKVNPGVHETKQNVKRCSNNDVDAAFAQHAGYRKSVSDK